MTESDTICHYLHVYVYVRISSVDYRFLGIIMRSNPLKKLKYMVPEAVISLIAVAGLLAAFVVVMTMTKYTVWYSVVAAVITVLLFSVCLSACIFLLGGELRKACGRPAGENPEDIAISPLNCGERPCGKVILRDILIISACCVVFALATVCLTALLRRAVGYSGSFSDLVRGRFGTLDSQHYLYIAEHGYTPATSDEYGRVVEIVFFPGYPAAVRVLGLIIKDYFAAGMIVSFISFNAAAVLLYLLMTEEYSRQDAWYAVIILFLMPGSFFFVSPMSESMFLALTLGTLLLIKKKKWLGAGACGLYCAFTRSAGIIIAAVFVFELFKDFLSELAAAKASGQLPAKKVFGIVWSYFKKCIPVLLIGFGLLMYLVINCAMNGDPLSFVYYEKKQWGQSLGWFFETAAYSAANIVKYMSGEMGTRTYTGYSVFAMNLVAMTGILTTIAVKWKKLRGSYVFYALAYFAVSYGVTWLLSGMRYMDGLFLMPMALAAGSGKYLHFKMKGSGDAGNADLTPGRVRNIILMASMAALSAVYLLFFCKSFQIW